MATKEDNKTLPTHVVGIGASAGGLEALQDFFGNLPSDTQAAYVVVQHLSPDYKSMMSELLSKHTDIPIFEVKDNIVIEARAIYLLPPRKNMLIAEGKLLLSDQMPDSNPHMPIDVFFRSLAEDRQHKAIGVILSGTGSDGTRGIRAMKESGGLVVIQEPESAKFDGMPKSAFNTGLADMVLSAYEMGKSLVNYMNHPSISGELPVIQYSTADGDDDILSEIFALLKQKSSINFSQYKPSTVSRRIERRISINKLTSLDGYLRLLLESPREVQILNRELLINVTRFFRDEEAFEKLIASAVKKVLNNGNKDDPVRLWVAGCSSGEEAYSIAMIFDEAKQELNIDRQVKIFATDVDEEAIAEASNGLYSSEIVDDISAERLERYFDKESESYRVSPSLRKMVIFAQHNMIEDPPFSNINLISCRNALIYFQQSAQQKVFSSFYFALRKEGYLFLGNSESLGNMHTNFDIVDERSRIFQKVGDVRLPIPNNSLLKSDAHTSSQSMIMPSLPLAARPSRMVVNNKYNAVMERLIKHYAPDSIVLNDSFDAVLVYGDVSKYTKGLASGKVSTNIKELIKDNLSVAISTALYRSEKNGEDVFYNDVGFVNDGKESVLDIAVFVVKQSEHQHAPRSYVLQFIEHIDQSPLSSPVKGITFDASEQSQQRIDDLEQELIKKQEHLQVTVEELETTNEELQSANEELMSANEEMQSTNEELQSVNEELYTVNSEYQEKINQLTEANVDLDSVINSTDIGILFLDQHLTIRKFTPHATNYVNLRASDIGRPIHHISHELDLPELLTEIAKVSTDGVEVERDVLTKSGQAALIRILPYAQKEYLSQSNQGVLITITNISRLKFVENALTQAQNQFRQLIQTRSERLMHRIKKSEDVSVLIVDDDKVDRETLVRFLGSDKLRSYTVFEAATKDEGLDVLKRVEIDVILLDYLLADSTAADFSSEARKKIDDVAPIILLSGQDEANMDSDFLSDDIVDSISKEELNRQLLTKVIDYALERQDVKKIMQQL